MLAAEAKASTGPAFESVVGQRFLYSVELRLRVGSAKETNASLYAAQLESANEAGGWKRASIGATVGSRHDSVKDDGPFMDEKALKWHSPLPET